MRRIIYFCLLAVVLAGCATQYQMPPFGTSGQWRMEGNAVVNEGTMLKLDFGSNDDAHPITNASNRNHELHFITSQAEFEQYDPACVKMVKEVLKSIPLQIDTVDVIVADEFMVLTTNITSQWRPDLYCEQDGKVLVEQAWPVTSLVQPHDQVWRNIIFNKKAHRIVTVDRMIKRGRHYAIVQIFQSNSKNAPWVNWGMMDVTSTSNIQHVGLTLDSWFRKWVTAWETDYTESYNDCIAKANECYLRGDYTGASAAFGRAFDKVAAPGGSDLYNGACVAALARENDVAFARLNKRLTLEPNWYVDDPTRDTDLASLHNDARWPAYCDTIIARRDRIEANYDLPLRRQLQDIAQSDQEIRYAFLNAYQAQPVDQHLVDSLTREMNRIDSINQAAICHILDTRGFVGSDVVGNACNAFWLVIQHAPLELQKKYFPMFVQGMQRGDLPKANIALMDDRIAMFEGRPQKYGSQLVEGDDGKMQLHPLLDPAMVDQWRKEMDLPPLSDYLKQMGIEQ